MTNSEQRQMQIIAAEELQLSVERSLRLIEEHRVEASRAYAREIMEEVRRK